MGYLCKGIREVFSLVEFLKSRETHFRGMAKQYRTGESCVICGNPGAGCGRPGVICFAFRATVARIKRAYDDALLSSSSVDADDGSEYRAL